MPVIDTPSRQQGNEVATDFISSITSLGDSFYLPGNITSDYLRIDNLTTGDLYVTVGTQTDVLIEAFESASFTTETFAEFSIRAAIGMGSFRARVSHFDYDEMDEKTLSNEVKSLKERLDQAGNSNPEVVEARGTFSTLEENLVDKDNKIGILQEGAGYNLRWNALLSLDGDWTAALQAAVNNFDRVYIPKEIKPLKINNINISKNTEIYSSGAEVELLSVNGFTVTADLDYLTLRGITFKKPSDIGGVLTTALYTNYKKINRLIIEDNSFNHIALDLGLSTDNADVFIKRNKWTNTSSTYTLKQFGYLHLSRNPVAVGVYTGRATLIEQNVFDVYCQDGDNVDVIKIGGGNREVVIRDNWIMNNNLNSVAQVDVFIGGHKLRFFENNLKNVQFMRKEVKGSTPNTYKYSYDMISHNNFEYDKNSIIGSFLNVRGSIFQIVNNNIVCNNADRYVGGIVVSDGDSIYDEFNTTETRYALIQGNTIDIRTDTYTSGASMYALQIEYSSYIQVLGNTLLGGTRIRVNGISTFANNTWLPSSFANTTTAISGLKDNNLSVVKNNRIDNFPALQDIMDSIQFKGVRVGKTTPQTMAADVVTNVVWEVKQYDNGGFFNSANPTQIKIPQGVRKVRLRANILWESAATSPSIKFIKNGTEFEGMGSVFLSSVAQQLNVSTSIITVAEGDVFELQVRQRGAAALNLLQGNTTWFELEVIS